MMLSTLVRATVEGAILVSLIWIASRTLRRLSPAAQTVLWWCAAVKFVVALIWTAPIALPILPATNLALPSIRVPSLQPPTELSARVTTKPANELDQGRGVWPSAAIALWTIGCLAATAVALRRWRQTLAVITRSSSAPEHIQAMAVDLAGRLELETLPTVRFSDEVETPFVAGLWRPAVVLPARRITALTRPQQEMTLCHELAHVKRGDLWLGCGPALAERLFFFHQLVHLATR